MRAAVIEDQTLVREYLAGLVRREFGGTDVLLIGSFAELRAREPELATADLLLIDVDLGDGSTVDWAIARRQSAAPGAMVALSSLLGIFPYRLLHDAGLTLVHKNDGEAALVQAIRATLTGATVATPAVMAILRAAGRDPHSPLKLLSPTEVKVLALLGQRLNNQEVAEELGCALATAADHRKRIMGKLGLHSIEEIIEYALRHGLVHDSRAAAAHHRRRPPPRN